jgi:tetrahydromethanopterin S-methyltransferase subunit C
MTQPEVAGPNRDGSKSLARESKYGLAVTFVTTVLAIGALGWLTDLDTSTVPGWAAGSVTFAVTTVIGLLTAYVTKNRTALR